MKRIQLLSLLLALLYVSLSFGQLSPNDLVIFFKDRGDSIVHIPVNSNYNYNYDVDWNNDGVFDQLGITDSLTHKMNTRGVMGNNFYDVYKVRIRGGYPAIDFSGLKSRNRIDEVSQWGNILIKDFSNAFSFCSSFSINATDQPNFDTMLNVSCENAFKSVTMFGGSLNHWDMSSVTNMDGMFEGSSAFSSSIDFNSWDVSNVTSMKDMFKGCADLLTDFNNWDVSSVINMSGMFDGADNVIGDVTSWDVSSVIDMSRMFRGIDNFRNHNSNTINLSNWNVSSVTDMSNMFNNLGRDTITSIKNWDVSSVTNMQGMFAYSRTFNQNLGGWDISAVTDMSSMLDAFTGWGTTSPVLSIDNYDSTIIGWSQNIHQMNVHLGAANLEYCDAINARNQLITDGWIILGDTTNCITSIGEVNFKGVNLYPNPTSGVINLENLELHDPIEVYTADGKLVKEVILSNHQIDLQHLQGGLYFLRIGNSVTRVTLFK